MKVASFIGVLGVAQLCLAAPNALPEPLPSPEPTAAPEADPQFGGVWSGVAQGVSSGISAGIATGVSAGFQNPWNIPGAIATGIASGVQTGFSQSVGNIIGNAQPGYCNRVCPQVQCSGVNACQCQNVATMTCWVSSGFSCQRPQLASCNGQSATGNNPTYGSCGNGLPACPSGTTCDRSLTVGCIDFTGRGNCIGVCVPNYAPYSPAQNPSSPVSVPYQIIPSQPAALSPARTQCRGPGYDVDCANGGVCISDPAAPLGANVPGVCATITSSCGGTQMRACQQGKICVDDPRDACPAGGQGCLGLCV